MGLGSFLGKIGGALKTGVEDVGHVAGDALKYGAPAAMLIPGVGPGVAAALEGLGQLMAPGGNIGKALIGGGETYAGGKLASVLGGMGSSGAAAGSADIPATMPSLSYDPVTGAVTNAVAGAASAAAPAASGGWTGALGNLFNSKNAPALISAAGGLAGNYLSGKGQGQIAQADMAERQREFQATQGTDAMSTQANLDSAPLRDRASYLLQARLGQTPQPFQPKDMFNPSSQTPQMGGVNTQAMTQANNAYTPGAGGINTSTAQQFLSRLGYPPTPLGSTATAPQTAGY